MVLVRHLGLIELIVFIGHLYLSGGVWLGEI